MYFTNRGKLKKQYFGTFQVAQKDLANVGYLLTNSVPTLAAIKSVHFSVLLSNKPVTKKDLTVVQSLPVQITANIRSQITGTQVYCHITAVSHQLPQTGNDGRKFSAIWKLYNFI